jgi:hypothetical protein
MTETHVPKLLTVSAYRLLGMPLAVWLAFARTIGPVGIRSGSAAGLRAAALGLCLLSFRKTKGPSDVQGAWAA